jgi:hypothetical protein
MRATEVWREEIEKGVMPRSVQKTFIPDAPVQAVEEGGVRKAAFILSTSDEDRDGDVISQSGWHLDDYRKNPVVLFAHDLKSLPIGKAPGIGVIGGALKSPETIFPDKGVHPFADQVYGLVKGGFLRGTSVGFHPLEAESRKGVKKGVAFARQSLYEFSILPIPSNKNALLEAKSEGHDIDLVVKWAGDFLDYAEAEGIWVPAWTVKKALMAVLPISISVPAMPPATGGHAFAGAEVDLGAISDEIEGKSGKAGVEKGGEDQPRDENGRFASTGGSTGGSGNAEPAASEQAATLRVGANRYSGPGGSAIVSRDAALNEYRVRHYSANGTRNEAADYFTNDKEDAHATAHAMASRAGDQTGRAGDQKGRHGKGATMDVLKDFADTIFGDVVKKGGPPWMKEGQEQEPEKTEPAGEPAGEAEEPSAEQSSTDPTGETPGAPPAGEPGEAGQDALEAALLAELAPLKAGGDPVQGATAVKAALEKFAAAFMQTYYPTGVAAPGTPPPAPGAPPAKPGTPLPVPGAPPAAAPAPAAAPPAAKPNPFEKKKGFEIEGVGFLSADEVRAMIESATKHSLDEAKMHLTGRLADR